MAGHLTALLSLAWLLWIALVAVGLILERRFWCTCCLGHADYAAADCAMAAPATVWCNPLITCVPVILHWVFRIPVWNDHWRGC